MAGHGEHDDVQARIADAALLEETAVDLYENAPTAYVSSLPDGTIVKVNATFVAWTGHTREDVVGRKRLHDLFPPGGRIYYESHYAPLLQMQGSVREIALEIVCADGSRLPVLLNSSLVRDDAGAPRVVRTTIFNATDRRRYERELLRARMDAEARARAALALEHVNDGVLLVSAAGRVDVLNRAAARILAVDADAAAGRAVSDVVPEWETLAAGVTVGEPGRHVPATTVPIVRGGHELWVEVAGVDSGDGVVYTIRDITSDHRLDQLRNDLVAIVSHELRTPLTGALGAAQTLLAREDLHPDQKRALLELIVEQGERLSRILDQILLTSRIDTGELAFDVETFDAGALAERLAHEIGAAAWHRRIVVAAAPGVRARGDCGKTKQVLTNLLDNALKYSAGVVEIGVEARGPVARFTVADHGSGVPVSEHERIFEKFYRLDPAQQRGVGGTGLGLYVARELVTRMGGGIGLLPREDGTTVFVDLPLAP